MAVSKLLPSSGNNDFNIAIGSTHTSVTFDKEYSAGAYTITATGGDTSFDIYAYNSNGTLAGYTNSAGFTASIPFIKMVIIGHTAGSLLSFSYKKTYATVADNDEVTAGPFITSSNTTTIPLQTSTAVITGGNFATNITGVFTSATTATTYTATVTRNSVTQLTVGVPATIPTNFSPYTLTVQNPGVTDPSGSAANKINGLTIGLAPTWTTGSTVNITLGSANTITLAATAATGNTISSYTIVSGTLPTGFSLNTSTGVISGTPSTGNAVLVFRATDSTGSWTDKTITFNANPVWTTAAGALTSGLAGNAYSFQLAATDDITPAGSLVYSLTGGTLPTGITLSSAGLLSGTPTGTGTSSFTVTVTDANSNTTARAFSIYLASLVTQQFTATGTTSWTYPAGAIQSGGVQYLVAGGGGSGGDGNAPGGGGGAGGLCIGTLTLTPGTAYSVSVGAGATSLSSGWDDAPGFNGTASWFVNTSTVYANGGGRGGGYGGAPGNGGSGGGGSGPTNTTGGGSSVGNIATGGTAYGNSGGASYPGGGGGAGGAGSTGGAGAGFTSSFSGSSYTYCTGGLATSQNGTNYGDGGGRGNDTRPGSGANGIVILKYYA